MVFNPKELDQLQFNREYRDTLNENFKGVGNELKKLDDKNYVTNKRLTTILVNPNGGGNPEVLAARTAKNGITYNSLFQHTEAMESDIEDNANNIQQLLTFQDKFKKRINIDEPVDIYYYVNKAIGSDTNTGLSVATPFKTIQKALDTIPQLTSGGEITVWIDNGTYAEDLVLRNKKGSDIKLVGNQNIPTNVKINSFYAVNVDAYLNVSGMEATTTTKDGFYYNRCSYINTNNCVATKDNKTAGMAGISYSASKGAVSGCTVSNSVHGIIANFSSQITIESNCTGTGNTNGISCARSIIHKYGNNTVVGTKNENIYGGGIISNGGTIG
ncbi:hypothetical protein QUF86_20270 [Peribacillus sp. NJ11]|uniref:hypothetical protein n=1 Tax=Peribacillus sp. NJ11 TaxID=3055861 RepID=UPI0025A1A46C|nr:hypothetical protein [Peribacillus sp. NJ11]MDM5223031.1 hypothetical protein [Peribacillus sp. NJ11]